MRTHRPWKPTGFEPLEDRVVPAQAVVPPLFDVSFVIPAEIQQLQPVKLAFNSFIADYTRAVQQILLAPGSDGSINPVANRQAFNEAVTIALTRLDNSVISAVASTNPANSQQLAAEIQQAILGEDPQSLASRLAALPNPPATPGTQPGPLVLGAVQEVEQSVRVVLNDLQQGSRLIQVPTGNENAMPKMTGAPDLVTFPTTSSVQVTRQVRQAYSAFLHSYFQSMQEVLFAPGPDGTVNPAANRAAFNERVNTSLQSLQNSISGAVGNLPSSGVLTGQVRQAILGSDPNSLQARLSALPTPLQAQGSALRVFGFNSTRAIGSSLALLMGDVAAFVRGTGTGK